MNIVSEPFGKRVDGTPVERFILSSGAYQVSVLTMGGIVQSFIAPDKKGRPTDVVLGFDSVQAYEAQDCYIGALIGRCANRIAGGSVVLGGHTYQLACNDNGTCHLHGGTVGFDRHIWLPAVTEGGLTLSYTSPDGEEGYPGELSVSAAYRLEGDTLTVTYCAKSSKDTLCNLTNHTYWNLAGHNAGQVDTQRICVHAAKYTPLGDSGTATGVIAHVDGTPLDLRYPTPFGAHWDDSFDQIVRADGFDHNYLVEGEGFRPFAQASCSGSGIALLVSSDLPGMQLYTGNFLSDNLPIGKGGAQYGRRHGFCVETQFPPNAVNCPAFPQPFLCAGDTWKSTTAYRVSLC